MPRNSLISDNSSMVVTLSKKVEPSALLLEVKPEEKYTSSFKEPELVFITEGQIIIAHISGKQECIERGYFTLIMPGHLISLTALIDSTLIICRLQSEQQLYEMLDLASLMVFSNEKPIYSLQVNEDISIFLDGFTPFLRKGFSSCDYLNTKITELLYLLSESYSKTDLAALFHPLLGEEIAFRNFVYSNINNVNSVRELAILANMSTNGFRTRFIKIMGESPSDMIVRHKAEMIKQSLKFTDMPLKEISEKYGFSSIHVFTRFCSRNLGHSPGTIRKNKRLFKL